MDKKLKKQLQSAFEAPSPTKKATFLNQLPYPKATHWEFCIFQVGYIRKRFWCLSVLLLIGMVGLSLTLEEGKEIVGVLSAVLPLLTLISITEISKSVSFHMTELEMSCKYNLSKITLIRLSAIGAFHFILLLAFLFLFREQSHYGLFRYFLYATTPFLLSSYLSFWLTSHVASKDILSVCSGVTALVSTAVFILGSEYAPFYEGNYIHLWSLAFLIITVLLGREIFFFVTGKNEMNKVAL